VKLTRKANETDAMGISAATARIPTEQRRGQATTLQLPSLLTTLLISTEQTLQPSLGITAGGTQHKG